jgi:ribokinase
MFLVLGNVTIDEAMATDTWLAPGQTIVVGAPKRDLGGKGANQALVLSRTGAPVRFVAAIGRDAEGDWAAARLAAEDLSEADLLRVDYPTDRSLIFVSGEGENAIASTVAAAQSIDAARARSLVAALAPGDALLLQGNLSLAATRAALETARSVGARTIVNPSPIQSGFAELLPLIDMLVLNEGEASRIGGVVDPAAAAGTLRAAGAGAVVLTLGGRGALYLNETGANQMPAPSVTVVDTTGAGDTFIGVLVGALYHAGLPWAAAIEAAIAAAALTVQRAGTLAAFPSRAEIAAILGRGGVVAR